MIYYFFEIPGSLTLVILMIIFYGILLFCLLSVVYVICRLVWVIIKEPCREIYFDYLDWKKDRVRKHKKKTKWYEDYSRFK